MGDNFGDGQTDEKVHEVRVDDFYVGKHEVTQQGLDIGFRLAFDASSPK